MQPGRRATQRSAKREPTSCETAWKATVTVDPELTTFGRDPADTCPPGTPPRQRGGRWATAGPLGATRGGHLHRADVQVRGARACIVEVSRAQRLQHRPGGPTAVVDEDGALVSLSRALAELDRAEVHFDHLVRSHLDHHGALLLAGLPGGDLSRPTWLKAVLRGA